MSMQSRTLGKIAVFCASAAFPLMVASQAHAAAAHQCPYDDVVLTDECGETSAQSGAGLALGAALTLDVGIDIGAGAAVIAGIG
jgi:hypothetical protein